MLLASRVAAIDMQSPRFLISTGALTRYGVQSSEATATASEGAMAPRVEIQGKTELMIGKCGLIHIL